MKDKILRKFFLGFVQIHILHHAKKEPLYGAWMMEELAEHGYDMSPGTLYPLLHSMQTNGLLQREDRTVDGKIRKYYTISELGVQVLEEAKTKAGELFREIKE